MALIVRHITAADTYIGITMAIDTQDRQKVDYFIGTEVENTAMKGENTLFVVGIKPVEEILSIINDQNSYLDVSKHIKHIYFGTSQSFHPHSPYDWNEWDNMIKPLLVKDYWVTLDLGVEYCRDLNEQCWNEYHTFIPMISVKIPYIKLYNYNATLKIDDITWGDTNPGVWCHPLNALMSRRVYTDWKDYTGDTPVFPPIESKEEDNGTA